MAKHDRRVHARTTDSIDLTTVQSASADLGTVGKDKPMRNKPKHIRQIEPTPSSRSTESDVVFERRLKRGSFAEEGAKRHRKKKWLAVLGVVLLAAVIALAIGVYTYFKTTDSNLRFSSSEVSDALVQTGGKKAGAAAESNTGEPYYVLLTADLRRPKYIETQPEDFAYMLVRIDEANRKLTFVGIPAEISIEFPDGESHRLTDFGKVFNDAELIQAVSKFADVPLRHYVATDSEKLSALTDLVGGVAVDVSQQIDDPDAGHIVLSKGEGLLDGQRALVLLRADNVAGGFATTSANRVAFTVGLTAAALGSEGIGFANIVSEASRYVGTDWTTSELLSLGDAFRPMDGATIYQCTVPYSMSGGTIANPMMNYSSSGWKALMEKVKAGEDPVEGEEDPGSVDVGRTTIEIRNATSINGAAADLQQTLNSIGYNVVKTGNTDDGAAYPETLVVYTDQALADVASALVRDMGIGRTVYGGDFYTSDQGVIVIIGNDWTS